MAYIPEPNHYKHQGAEKLGNFGYIQGFLRSCLAFDVAIPLQVI